MRPVFGPQNSLTVQSEDPNLSQHNVLADPQ